MYTVLHIIKLYYVSKAGSASVIRCKWEKYRTQFKSLKRAGPVIEGNSSNGLYYVGYFPLLHMTMEADPASERLSNLNVLSSYCDCRRGLVW
jgi:hypothetical protein